MHEGNCCVTDYFHEYAMSEMDYIMASQRGLRSNNQKTAVPILMDIGRIEYQLFPICISMNASP
jgi:hypothetical protein